MTITEGSSEPRVDQSASGANVTGSQGSVAAGNINQTSINITNHYPAPQSYDDFIADFNANSPAGRYGIFWSGKDEHRKRSLDGSIDSAEAKAIIARRTLDGNGTHVQECADLIKSINRDRARMILKLMDKEPGRKILTGMADGLGEFLVDVSARSTSDAAYFLHLAATDRQFRDSFKKVFTADAARPWRQIWMNELDPACSAFILAVAGGRWPREILAKMPAPRAAQAIVSENGAGRWLTLLKGQHRSDVLVEAARQNPDNLAARLTEIPYAQASELISVLSRDQDVFRNFTAKLSEWHLVIFAAGADLTPEQLEPLLPRLRAAVKVWPWLAAFRAIRAVAPDPAAIPGYGGTWNKLPALARTWWLVRKAAAKWTSDLREQRERDVKMYAAGAVTTLAVLIVITIAL